MDDIVSSDTEVYLARCVAAEDLCPGDMVALLDQIFEVPSYMWDCDPQLLPPSEPVRIQCRAGDSGEPLKVKAICLPFVFVKTTNGQHLSLDVRKYRLVRLNPIYAKRVWKRLRKQQGSYLCK